VVRDVAELGFAVFGVAVRDVADLGSRSLVVVVLGLTVHTATCRERRARAARAAACFTIRPHLETDPMGLEPMVKQVCG
jgi:hypothetical protein